MIPAPFLLYLGHSADVLGIKTSRGVAAFRRQDCVGEFRHDDCPLTLGLPRLGMAEAAAAGARTLILGIAGAGGKLGADLVDDAATALEAGMNVASGLHQRLRDEPRLAALARERGLTLFDVRDPPAGLMVGKGYPRRGHRLLTVGTDCSVGKMYASIAIADALRARAVAADFRATGQTGILIAGNGIAVDAVVADFISGAIEQLTPSRDDDGWDVIEGQGSLFHPSFAGVSMTMVRALATGPGGQAPIIRPTAPPASRASRSHKAQSTALRAAPAGKACSNSSRPAPCSISGLIRSISTRAWSTVSP